MNVRGAAAFGCGTRRCLVAAAMLGAVAATVASVNARTWTVEKDGSGDFTVIQDAVDAAGPGDTVLIGTGTYSDYHEFDVGSGQSSPTLVGVAISDLTIIGVGTADVIIKPPAGETVESGVYLRRGFGDRFQLKSVTIGDVLFGVNSFDSVAYVDVKILDCNVGAYLFPDSTALLKQCRIEGSGTIGVAAGSGAINVRVEDCELLANDCGINFTWPTDPVVERCQFFGNGVGISVSGLGVQATIRDSYFEGATIGAITIRSGAEAVLLDNVIGTDGGFALDSTDARAIHARRNRISGGRRSTLSMISTDRPLDIQYNEFFKGSGHLIEAKWYFDEPTLTLQFSNNYWGTTDPDSLAVWIWDGNDDPEIKAIVDIDPILQAPLPAEQKSVGQLKGPFGPDPEPRR